MTPERIAERAREAGLAAVGLADRNNFYGLIRFLKAAGREGVKPVAGAVLEIDGRPLCTAHVLNLAGYRRLSELLSLILVDETRRRYFPAGGETRERKQPRETAAPALRSKVIENLLTRGWDGLALASDDAAFLLKLKERETRDLFVKLTYGKPFAGSAGWAAANRLPCLAVTESAAETPEEVSLLHLLKAIDLRISLARLPAAGRAGPHSLLPAPGRIAAFFNAVPEALRNAEALIAESSTAGIIHPRPVFPSFRGLVPDDAFALLAALCRRGVTRRYGKETPSISARLDYELGIIRDKGFASYFLVVHDIVRRCPRTCGRGSAAASIVSYLLGITHVDPLRYNLFFERFLNRGRSDPPDIDVDFPWDEREKTLAYVFRKYSGRAGMVADHVTFGPRSSLREPAKAWGLSDAEITRLVNASLAGEEEKIPAGLLSVARRLRGLPRHIGTHPGGVVITPEPLTAFTHFQISPLGYPVIAWEKDATEDAGLVKIDLLGNRSLGVLRDAMREVNSRRGAGLDWRRFDPLTDRATERLIASGDTVGIFYIESPATRQLLRKMGKADYGSLVIASSIIRPAANRYIREFVDRLHGKPYAPLHPGLAETLKETFGVMVYQEDVSRVAIAIAGFSPEQADRLRKVLSKKAGKEGLVQFQELFFAGARRAGMGERAIRAVWEMILSFDGYSFCKAHSASYAQVSYRLAWLKRRYPLEFMASVINNGGGFYTRQTYLDEVRRLGFRLLPADVNKSELVYTVEEGGLRVGLRQLADVARPFLEGVVREREERGAFRDFFDFVKRTSPGPSEISVLVRSGALDSIGGGCARPALFFLFFQRSKLAGDFFPEIIPSCIRDYPPAVKLRDELETLGLFVSRHPLSVFASRIAVLSHRHRNVPLISSRLICSHRERRVAIAGALVTGKEARTRREDAMMFVSFSDEEAIFETVFFPEVYARFHALLFSAAVFFIIGTVKDDRGALSLQVETLERLTRDPDARGERLSERRKASGCFLLQGGPDLGQTVR